MQGSLIIYLLYDATISISKMTFVAFELILHP